MNLWLRVIRILFATWRAARLDPTESSRLTFRVMPTDLDINMHMTNSRYLAFMDLGRLNLILRSRLGAILRRERWAPVIGGSLVQFRRPLAPFQKFEIATRVIGRDDRWLYIEHRITSGGELSCLAMVRGAFLHRGKVVPPEEVARRGGFADSCTAIPDNLNTAWQAFRAAAE